jgi:multidrug transporter EmrE-like cation transporter
MIKIILFFIGNVVFNSTGNVLIKVGIRKTDNLNLHSFSGIINGLIFNPALLIGIFSYMTSLVFYIFVLKEIDLSTAYPISVSCAIVLVTIVSNFLLNETISINQVIGGAFILFGIFILTH